ncbi:Co2+/Mg2+ efflux protein ApaG [Crenobacter sp. SG2303]|uniref:Protein ApaG n=1 Tax=Crenobacter oryzisoli TaxID=3056844 RepID=A0ABT7XUE8_9NEIS|nr:Co2+/Mg2+ efflux protein ApaG [Crenobacter sp. SG2303]MDN0077360.1 Co2+/Mg2+ efflux protein ApaG [Crenobacter sp. SG2303]
MEKKYSLKVETEVTYLADKSDVTSDRYVFGYRIRMTNTGTVRAKLVSRHWIITDANHQKQEVRGMGVVGEHPDLAPGESYEYTSGVSLTTPWGTMQGSYQMLAEDSTRFDAEIPEFVLTAPRVLH